MSDDGATDLARDAVAAVRRLLRHHDGADPLLVAVGGCGPARLPVAAAIAAALDAVTVDMAEFHRPMDAERRSSLDAQTTYELTDDWQRLIRDVLDPLVLGDAAAYHRYDWAAGRLGVDARIIEPHGAVVVHGAFVLRPQLRGYWDIAVQLSAEPETDAERWFAEHVVPEPAPDVTLAVSW